MNSVINVTSEIGKLKKVILHRPGREIENLVPEYLERLLFDDIPYLKVARQEHDYFAQLLKDNGVEVLYLEELLSKALTDNELRQSFLNDFLMESKVVSPSLVEVLMDHLLSVSVDEMVESVMAGIRKNQIEIKQAKSLSEVMTDDYPFYLDPMPNLYFTRDPGAVIGNGLSINRMQKEARRRETLFLKYIHNYFSKIYDIPLLYDRGFRYTIEGGDELVLSRDTVAVGCSERTTSEAIETMASNLFKMNESFERVMVFEIPKRRAFMHLDTVFTMVDYNKFTIHPVIQKTLNVYEITRGKNGYLNIKYHEGSLECILKDILKISDVELIKCGGGDLIAASREQWNDGSNTLAIAPGVVITYERNYVTNEILDKRGIKVLAIPSSELSRGRGGPRCMSMPLERENI